METMVSTDFVCQLWYGRDARRSDLVSQMSLSTQMGSNEIFLTNEIHIILFLRYSALIILSFLREHFSWQGRCEYHRSILSHFSDIFIYQMRVEMSSEDSMTASSSMARIMEDLIL